MTTDPDPVRALIQEWAAEAASREVTRLSPAMLRAKHLLAREDRRRRRTRALQASIVTLPFVLLAMWHPWPSVALLADGLASAQLPTLAAVAGTVCLAAWVGATWVAE